MSNRYTDLRFGPAARRTNSPQRKSPFENNTEINPLGAPWTLGLRTKDEIDHYVAAMTEVLS